MGHTMKILNLIFLIIFCIVLLVFPAHAVASSNEKVQSHESSVIKPKDLTHNKKKLEQEVEGQSRSTEIFSTSFGAALGGFLGASIWFIVRSLIARLRPNKNVIKSYSCANRINLGDNNEMDGELKHYHGKRVDNYSELRFKNPVWEWTKKAVGNVESGDAVIYGPYSTDFAESGKYSVAFMVKGMGFTQPQDITRDVPVLLLDVNRSIEQYVPVDGKIKHVIAQNRFAVRYVRASELATSEWQSFELVFNCDGPGLWEYRVYAYDGVSLQPDNIIGEFGPNVRIFFDKVTISKINKVQISW